MSATETRSLVVTTVADSTGLTTIEAVKTDLGITDTSEDDRLQTEIARASSMICSHLMLVSADDGTVTLGREILLETIYPCQTNHVLRLSRQPIASVQSVTENGVVLDAADYQINNNAGTLRRIDDGRPSLWLSEWSSTERSIIIAYTAGWLLPSDSGRNLPLDIEYAAIALVKAARFSRARDPALLSEDILQGLYGYRLKGDASSGAEGIPDWIANLLNHYRIY